MTEKYKISNGYVLVYKPEHHKAIVGGDWDGFVYEHVLVAEETLGRRIKEGEDVHHLDLSRANNSPDNLIVLSHPMHLKLHAWMNKNEIIPSPEYQTRIELGCVRCIGCNKPIHYTLQFCSHQCNNLDKLSKSNRPSKEVLAAEVLTTPMIKLGEKYNVSGNAVKQWCKNYEIELPDRRGYWTKIRFSEKK